MLANRGRILAAAEGGDHEAFLGLYDQFCPMLYRFFFWLTGNESEARELVVATFRRAFGAFRKRPRTMVLDTWFYRMAVRTFLASARWQRLIRRAPGPVEIEDRTMDWRRAVIALPPRLRVVWLLILAEGMPQSQTAEALGVSLERAESLFDRAHAAYRPPDPDADRPAVERVMRQLRAPRPGATLRVEVAAALGTGETTLRIRLLQGGIGLMVFLLAVSVGFSLFRGEDESEASPVGDDAAPKTIVVLGTADIGALLSFSAKDLRPSSITGVGNEPRALALTADGKTLYVLQEDGLLTVDAQSQQVGPIIQLPDQDWSSLAVTGLFVVLGSHTATLLVTMDENDELLADIPLPWSVDRLLPLSESAVLAVAADRTQMVRVALDTRTVGDVITIGADLVIGAVVLAADGLAAFVTTPETDEIWRVDLDSRQVILFATTPAARATYGLLSEDGTVLYLGSEAESIAEETGESDSSESADVKSKVPASGSSASKDAADAETAQEEVAEIATAPALTMINTADGSVERQLWQGGGVTQMALDSERNILYALAPHASAILVLDSRTFHVRNVVPLPVRAVTFTLVASETN